MQQTHRTATGEGAGLRSPDLLRAIIAGVLMGLANLVPGISGGTMLVVSGVYTRFIDAISDLTRMRLRLGSLILLGAIAGGAGAAIVLLAGPIAALMVTHRWAMYALFIGLTWGSVPVLLALLPRRDRRVWIGAIAGIATMVLLAVLQERGATAGGLGSGPIMLGLAGVAGASAMILPGVSGAYLLLLLGQYLPILESIRRLKDAVHAGDPSAILAETGVILPVAIGVVVGIVVVSNLLRWLLHRYEALTLGVLLGLVVGAPAGLYPFKRGIEPTPGEVIRGELVTQENIEEFIAKPSRWREQAYAPTPGQVLAAAGLIVLGGAVTLGIARLGREPAPDADGGRSG